jgi:hypothetical protein
MQLLRREETKCTDHKVQKMFETYHTNFAGWKPDQCRVDIFLRLHQVWIGLVVRSWKSRFRLPGFEPRFNIGKLFVKPQLRRVLPIRMIQDTMIHHPIFSHRIH